MAQFNINDPDVTKKLRSMFSPGQVDQGVRHAIQMCWMMLPENRKNIDELEKQFRRIADRALKDLRKDAKSFGIAE